MVRGRASSEDSSAEVSVEFVTNYLASLDEQDSDTDDDGSPVATQVRDVRKRVWTTWNRYTAKNTNITARFWIDFARFPHRKELRNAIRAFMRVCVEESKTFQVVLGPEERIKARTINSAHSLIQVLRALVAAADAKVLKPERQALRDMGKHDEAARLFLRWDQQNERREGPAFETVSWILNKLAKELNLQIEPTYAKVEATAEDIIVVLLTLYHRAEDIPAPTPITRISFHAALLISAAGGCRPGMVMGLKCKHFALSMVRDPKDKARTRIVVTVTIPRNKQLRDISCRTTGRNKPPVQYSSPLLPFPVLCLASLVIARALQMGAIETSLQSAHELFRRPVLGSVDVIPIKWKADFEERDLFPLTYPQFRSLWAKCVMVMGCRKPIRPYALRVGAGNRMDDQLSGALRNYVMSHTSDVFETAYQTSHVRVNLPGIAFGEDNVDRDEELFSNLRKMSLTSDDGAPISVPREEIRKFDERQDMKDFLAKLDICLPQEKMKLRSKMANRKAVLTKLQLEANRQSYFEQADRLRLHGRQPTHSSVNSKIALA
ncbi:hypothetical protein NKR19_g9595 [Coniochaeta hoffmannii]|uniref:Uncharacterized protein n=1 Tax=Coniochaeta hoffmannii TaxID=91930 RepID=A0AA38VB85_9PEZI|nr:hypothetical protein NKR19_g9595 [Coniochaeta hoffmannii]